MSDQRKHLVVRGFRVTEAFRARSGGGGTPKAPPPRNRSAHSTSLSQQLDQASQMLQQRIAQGLPSTEGITLDIRLAPDLEDVLKTLESKKKKIEIRSFYQDQGFDHAVIAIPDSGFPGFIKELKDYAGGTGTQSKRRLFDAIEEIQVALLQSMWTDRERQFPLPDQPIFWEVWLVRRRGDPQIEDRFRQQADQAKLWVGTKHLQFHDRTVLVLYGSANQLAPCAAIVGTIAEVRQAEETAEFFLDLPPSEEKEWVNSLVGLIQPPPSGAPLVCLLDTGVDQGHPLLAPALPIARMHAVKPSWQVGDHHVHGHGTGMAGLALYGDLVAILPQTSPYALLHGLESVKVEAPPHQPWPVAEDGDEERLHGSIIMDAVSQVEIQDPDAVRVFCLPRTSIDTTKGEPTSWSAALDELSAGVSRTDGYLTELATPRLFLVSAGNIGDLSAIAEYPARNEVEQVQSPAQAWNVLTVGAFTEKVAIHGQFAGMTPIAVSGDLAPMSTTGVGFSKGWPRKPEIVFEGGNYGRDKNGQVRDDISSLYLLTTKRRTSKTTRLLTEFNGTSAAVAQAARMAAILCAQYPNLWPETIRALMVHSARWTDRMLHRYLDGKSLKEARRENLRTLRSCCGWGVPSMERACWSTNNSLVLIAEDQISPFKLDGSAVKMREMHLHHLPWPEDALRALSGTEVQLRVTLSYFIEPSPGRRGRTQHRYQSHGLRLGVKRPTESVQDFRIRINQAAIEEDEGRTDNRSSDNGWVLGPKSWATGSIHNDIWIGTAADLADRGVLAVYPVGGWWKDRKDQQRYDKKVRYALIVSIETPPVDVDLYAIVENQIKIAVEV